MTRPTELLWTIDELGTRVALALSVDYEGPPNGRVRQIPDQRTIRYYTTLGLIDRPAQMRGRTALYGRRHLLQLVAIKRLQARGLTLAELQERLLGLSNTELETIARVPADLDATPGAAAPPAPEETPQREDFWKAAPAGVNADDNHVAPAPVNEVPAEPLFQGIPLAEGVTLLLAPARPLDNEDLEALRVAAGPLLKLLHKRRLLRMRTGVSP
jgi:DNA-binding transcriptional MerR regulator